MKPQWEVRNLNSGIYNNIKYRESPLNKQRAFSFSIIIITN